MIVTVDRFNNVDSPSAPTSPPSPLVAATAPITHHEAVETTVNARNVSTEKAALETDLVVALGSMLSLNPAAEFPLVAARRGVPYVIINRGPTDHDEIATLRLEGDVGEILPPAVEALS